MQNCFYYLNQGTVLVILRITMTYTMSFFISLVYFMIYILKDNFISLKGIKV